MRVSLFASIFVICLIGAPMSHGDVLDLSAIINVSQEIPAPTNVPAAAGGFAALQYDDISKELSWDIAWQGLSGAATGMHFHAPAGPSETAGVAVNVGDISGLTSPSVGSVTLSDEFAAQLLSGQSYINIHTEQNAPGEIRGQVDPTLSMLAANLDAAQEIPAPSGVLPNATGSAQIAYDAATNLLGWRIEWDNLTGPATGMHFHGPAGFGETGEVKLDIGGISGLTSPSIGSALITDELENQLLGGLWYINIHTEANGPGEIRGQVVPEPSSAVLTIWLALVGLVGARHRQARWTLING